MAVAESQVFEDKAPLIRSCAALNEIRVAEEIKDLSIEVQNGSVLHVHRIIIAARIPSLRASLSGQRNEDNLVLRWPTVPLSVATTLIKYVYTGQVEITRANVRGLALLARMMHLPVLENWGATFLANGLTLDTLPSAWDFATSVNSASLMDGCIKLMQEQFQAFVQSDLFISLPADTVISLLQKDDLPVNSEEDVFAAISRWVCPCGNVDKQRLELHAPAMLKEVRWCQTTPQFRNDLVDNHQIFKTLNQCCRFMLKVEQWMSFAQTDKPRCPFNPRMRLPQLTQRESSQTSIFVFGDDADQKGWSVLCFDSDLRKAERVAGMEERSNASYTVIGENSIFVVGGSTLQKSYLTSVKEFLVRQRRWCDRAPLAIARFNHAATFVKAGGEKTLLGVFGGYNGSDLSSCEVYDLSSDSWFKLPDLREKRSACPAAISLPGECRIFIFGGLSGSTRLASVEFCQLGVDWQERLTSARTTDFWQPAAPMLNARSSLAATQFRGKIIVAGGKAADGSLLNAVESFTPPDANSPLGQWTALAGLQHPRYQFTLVTSTNAIFALANEWNNTVEAFTPAAGSADGGNDLKSWIWSSRNPVEALRKIWGAVGLRM